MAKSSSFFGLRRGSTKSLTFQILDGKQITKDRVTSVRNPKSNGQIMQRMRIKSAIIFQKSFKKYIDRGQEGISYGNASYRKWLSKALQTPGLYAAKNQLTLMPWTMPLTTGSLPTIGATYDGQVRNIKFPTGTDDALSVTDAQIIASNPDLMDGDQIAVVTEVQTLAGGFQVVEAAHILNAENTANDSLCADIERQGIPVDVQSFGNAPEEGEDDTRLFYMTLGYEATAIALVGCAVIHSRLSGSAYLRSTESLVTDDSQFTPSYANLCIDTWRDAQQRSHDWPEIVEEGFLPTNYYYVNGETEDADGNTTNVRILVVQGFNGNEYKRYAVGNSATNPTILYEYPTLNALTGATIASTSVDGYITKADFDAMFG